MNVGYSIRMGRELNVLLVIYIAIADITHAADMTTYCSGFNYKDGETAIVNGTVNANVVNGSICDPGSLDEIYFRFKSNTNSLPIEYNALYSPSGPCNEAWVNNVRCVSWDRSANVFTYSLMFVVNKTTLSQRYLTLESSCLPKNPNIKYTSDYSRCHSAAFTGLSGANFDKVERLLLLSAVLLGLLSIS